MRLLLTISLMTLLMSTSGRAQSVQEIQGYLSDWYRTHYPIKMSMTLHQPYYRPGDSVFYSIFIVDAALTQIEKTHIVSLHLVDSAGNSRLQQQVVAKKGNASGAVPIPADIEPGYYELVAFNDWMLNQQPYLFCKQTVLITGGKIFSRKSLIRPLQVRAEGGELVSGIVNRVYIQGQPDMNGSVQQGSNTIAQFKTNAQGFANTFITPSSLQAVSVKLGTAVAVLTPAPDGVACFVINPENNSQSVRVRITVPENSDIRKNTISLVVTRGHQLLYHSELRFSKKQEALITIPKNNLLPGINTVYIIQNKKVLCERLLMQEPSKADVSVALTANRTPKRSRLSATLTLAGDGNTNRLAHVNVRVFKKDLFQSAAFNRTVGSQFFFDSELPAATIKYRDLSVHDFDSFLALQTHPHFRWFEALSPQKKFDLRQDLRISSRIIDRQTGQPVPDSSLVSCYLVRHNIICESFTFKKGYFEGSLLQFFYGSEEAFLKAEYNGKPIPDISIEGADFVPSFPKNPLPYRASDQADPYWLHQQINRAVQISYQSGSTTTTNLSVRPSEFEKMPEADKVIDLDDYLLFPTMAETIKEIIPLLFHRQVKNKNEIRVYIEAASQNAPEAPVYIIDGVMTNDTDYFLQLKPADVDKIKIINNPEKMNRFGRIGQNGVVLVETKIPGHAEKIPRTTAHHKWAGLTLPIQYALPAKAQTSVRRPQLSPSLFWQPNFLLTGKQTIDILASDDVGRYIMIVEGLTSSGQPIYTETEFDITNEN